MSEGLLRKAELAFQKKDYQSALDITTKMLEENDNNYGAWVIRGAIMSIFKNYREAILSNDRALELEPDSYQALNNRAAGYMALNLIEEAVADLNKAIAIRPEAWEAHFQFGHLYACTDNLPAAEYHFREAVRISNGHHAPHLALGTLLLGLGRWREGFIEEQHRFRLKDIYRTF